MAVLELKAPAKLNLTLDILRKREDGYHDLRMVMHSISLCDRIRLDTDGGEGIRCSSNLPYLPKDEGNIAVKAALAFFRETGLTCPGLHIEIEKHTPACAGMAGGSSDGAAVLRGLRQLYAPELPNAELERIGAAVGSDVPYCIRGTTALAEGRGEILQDLPPLPACWFVVCKPDFAISTPELFRQVNVKKIRLHPDSRGMITALEQQDLEGVARRLYNVFEDFLPRRCGEVLVIKQKLLELGAMNAVMTGSGPTVFGIFRDKARAQEAYESLRREYRQTFLEQNSV